MYMNKNHTTHYRFKALLAFCILFISVTKSYAQADDFDRIQKVVASDRAQYETYGYSVSISGNYAAVGCPNSSLDVNGANQLNESGAVYVLEKNAAGIWVEVAKLTQPVRAQGDRFGHDVEISGTALIVGAPQEDEDANELNTLNEAGSAYIFERDGSGNWNFIKKITATIRTATDYFGNAVSISNNRALIAAPFNDTDANNLNFLNSAGAVYAFEKNGIGIWTFYQKIVASDRVADDNFGFSCDISDNYFVVGAPYHDFDEDNLNSIQDAGAAYVYSWGTPITLFHKRTAVVRHWTANFGNAVAIEGSSMAIAARGESWDENNQNPVNLSGAVYAYTLLVSPFYAFHFYDKMVAPDRNPNDYLGENIDLSGGHIIASSYNNYDNTLTNSNVVNGSGSSYLFKRTTGFNYLEKITSSFRNESEYFGLSVGLSMNTDGMVAIASCMYDSDDENDLNPLSGAGSAFIFGACIPSTGSITVTACNNYDFHGTVYTSSGTYVDTLPNAIGCDSLVTINLSIYAIDTTLSYVDGFVQSNQGNATYQWINCQTGLPVPGATSQVFNPSTNGLYKVVIYPTAVSCSDTSECVFINNVGINESSKANFSVYPNPSSKEIFISGDLYIQSFSLQSLNGEIVEQFDFTNSLVQSHVLDVSNLSKGIYFLTIISENSITETIKLSIQ